MPRTNRARLPRQGVFALLAVVVLVLAACGEPESDPTATAEPPGTESPGAAAPGDGELVFPRQQPATGHNDAGLPGTLIERDDCLWIEPEHSDELTLVIWWHDFDYAIDDGTIQILNGDGQPVAEVGDRVMLGGSGGDSWNDADDLPEACRSGPFWFASPDVLNVDEREANAIDPPSDFFTYQTSDNGLAGANKIAARVTYSDGCLIIQPSTEQQRYQAVWPAGTTLESSFENIDIHYADDQWITTSESRGYVIIGRKAADLSELEQLRTLDRTGPDSCDAPYWVVDSVDFENALEVDAATYAVERGVSLGEAVERLGNQSGNTGDEVATLNQELEANEADTFAGLWYQHEPDYRIVVAFTENGEQTLEPYLQGFSQRDLIEVREVEYTLQELRDAQAQAHDIIEQLDLEMGISSGTNIMENRTEVYVPDMAAFEAALSQAGVTLPEPVLVVEMD